MIAYNTVFRWLLVFVFSSAAFLVAQTIPLSVLNSDREAAPVLAHESQINSVGPDWVRDVTKSANFGDPRAQVELGLYLMRSLGTSNGAQQAFQWFQRAAAEESPSAMNNLAALYFEGRGVPRDAATGLRWALRAASHEYAPAEMNAGFAYWYGWGTPVSHEEALRWFRRAAKHGFSVAQCAMGVLYETGDGVPRDFAQAAKWYEKAAKQNHPAALNNLGVMSEMGKGVGQSFTRAADYYRRAANAGLPLAGTNLARLVSAGLGVQRDPEETCYWLAVAADADPVAARFAGRVCASLPESQQESARRRAAEWRRIHPGLAGEDPMLAQRSYPSIFETSVPAANLTGGH